MDNIFCNSTYLLDILYKVYTKNQTAFLLFKIIKHHTKTWNISRQYVAITYIIDTPDPFYILYAQSDAKPAKAAVP